MQNLDKGSVKFDTVECRRLSVVYDTGKAWVDDDGGKVKGINKEGSFSRLGIDGVFNEGYVGVVGKSPDDPENPYGGYILREKY